MRKASPRRPRWQRNPCRRWPALAVPAPWALRFVARRCGRAPVASPRHLTTKPAEEPHPKIYPKKNNVNMRARKISTNTRFAHEAILAATAASADIHPEADLHARCQVAPRTKRLLGVIAASLVPHGGSVFVDSGSTCLEAGRRLMNRSDVNLVSNSLALLMDADNAAASICALGGLLRLPSQAFVGAEAIRAFHRHRFDIAIIGASGIDTLHGPSTTEPSEAAVKTAALERAHLRMLIVHSAKWTTVAPVGFACWNAFNYVVTDAVLDRRTADHLRRSGIEIINPGVCCR